MTMDVEIGSLSLARQALASVKGSSLAEAFLAELRRGCAHPDALLGSLGRVGPDPAEVRAYCRRLQKALEVAVRGEAGR